MGIIAPIDAIHFVDNLLELNDIAIKVLVRDAIKSHCTEQELISLRSNIRKLGQLVTVELKVRENKSTRKDLK